jgi:hypothetical protein
MAVLAHFVATLKRFDSGISSRRKAGNMKTAPKLAKCSVKFPSTLRRTEDSPPASGDSSPSPPFWSSNERKTTACGEGGFLVSYRDNNLVLSGCIRLSPYPARRPCVRSAWLRCLWHGVAGGSSLAAEELTAIRPTTNEVRTFPFVPARRPVFTCPILSLRASVVGHEPVDPLLPNHHCGCG